uniref:Uncharacterized protein n=1 Tax=Anopheles culicifacies TaxID=139723 RepID=A0A182LY23_9DIPT
MLGHHASRTRPTRASPGHLQLHEAQQGTGHNISFLFTISLRYCGLGSGVLLTDERYRTIEFAKKEQVSYEFNMREREVVEGSIAGYYLPATGTMVMVWEIEPHFITAYPKAGCLTMERDRSSIGKFSFTSAKVVCISVLLLLLPGRVKVSVSLGPCSGAELWHPLGIVFVLVDMAIAVHCTKENLRPGFSRIVTQVKKDDFTLSSAENMFM